jgi:hypothetical protein
MVEAASQRTYVATELLLATILEAILRHVYNRPFSDPGKSLSFQNEMPKFRNDYLSDKWVAVCDRAVVVQDRLRQRNAHPDWMWNDASVVPWTLPDKRIADLTYLAEFYRGVALALVGLKDVTLDYLEARVARTKDRARQDGRSGRDDAEEN